MLAHTHTDIFPYAFTLLSIKLVYISCCFFKENPTNNEVITALLNNNKKNVFYYIKITNRAFITIMIKKQSIKNNL